MVYFLVILRTAAAAICLAKMEESPVKVLEGLTMIRGRLESSGADPATLQLVDDISRRAALPAARDASAPSLVQLVRMLARQPVASSNTRVYNDLVGLEEQLQNASAMIRAEREAEESRPQPKLKKFYKDQKAKEKKA